MASGKPMARLPASYCATHCTQRGSATVCDDDKSHRSSLVRDTALAACPRLYTSAVAAVAVVPPAAATAAAVRPLCANESLFFEQSRLGSQFTFFFSLLVQLYPIIKRNEWKRMYEV